MKLIRTFNSIAAIKSVLQKNSERPRNSVPLIPSLFLFAFQVSIHRFHTSSAPLFFPPESRIIASRKNLPAVAFARTYTGMSVPCKLRSLVLRVRTYNDLGVIKPESLRAEESVPDLYVMCNSMCFVSSEWEAYARCR